VVGRGGLEPPTSSLIGLNVVLVICWGSLQASVVAKVIGRGIDHGYAVKGRFDESPSHVAEQAAPGERPCGFRLDSWWARF